MAELVTKYQQYAEYKDSGVEWLGEIPKDWEVKRLKYLCKINTGTKDTVNAVEEGEYPFFVRSQTVERINSYGADCEAVLTAGDGVGVGKVYHYIDGKFDYHQRVYMLSDFNKITGRFLYYYLSSNFYKVALQGNAKSTVDSLRLPQFLNFEFSLPSLREQPLIVGYLDHETAQIDTLIEKQQILIKLLKEKRQAVISHAVTKGLNPDAPMKDSGVEWLGDVPEHWGLPKLIHQTSRIGDGLHSTPQYQDKTGYYFINGNNLVNGNIVVAETSKEVPKKEYEKHYIYLDKSSVLLSINGTIGNVARYNNELVILGKSAAYMNCSDSLLPEYLMLYLQSNQAFHYFGLEVTGTTIFNLSLNSIRQMKVCVPPKQEQSEIYKFCKSQKNRYDKLIEKATDAIRLMQERRTALISAAVTGKIDVRGWVAPE